jgi:hypothetical protein
MFAQQTITGRRRRLVPNLLGILVTALATICRLHN